MAKAKPTLGYPSRTDAVLALRGQGLSTEVIGHRIGIKPATVTALEHSAKRRQSEQSERRRPPRCDMCTVVFPKETLVGLRPYAKSRDISANEIARRIVETVLDEFLVDAVLDDKNEAMA